MQSNTITESVITLTESAAGEVKSMLQQAENKGKVMRVYVEQGGCSGMQYSMIFDEKRPDDMSAEMHPQAVLLVPVQQDLRRRTIRKYEQ